VSELLELSELLEYPELNELLNVSAMTTPP
jgi:hypothetical protein